MRESERERAVMHDTPIPGPLRLGDLLDRAFRLYRERLWQLLLTGAVLLAPLGVVTGLLTGQVMTSLMDAVSTTATRRTAGTDPTLAMLTEFSGLFVFQIVVGSVLVGWATLAITCQTIAALHGEPLTVLQGLRRSLGRVLALIGLALLMGLALLAVTAIVLVPFIIALVGIGVILGTGAGRGASDGGALAAVGLVLLILLGMMMAFVVLLVPAVYLLARWIAAVPALVAEQLGPVAALRRSWRLTKGHVWRSVGYLLLLYLLALVITGIPSSTIQQVTILALGPDAMGWATGISTGLNYIAQIVWLPLQTAALVLLYYDLRVRQEGYDLALRVERLEAEVAGQAVGRVGDD
jgi:hypothetical protein